MKIKYKNYIINSTENITKDSMSILNEIVKSINNIQKMESVSIENTDKLKRPSRLKR